MPITADQCRAGRALLDWSQNKLAEVARVSRNTVVSFEKQTKTPHHHNLEAITTALEQGGVRFIHGNGDGPGVRWRGDVGA